MFRPIKNLFTYIQKNTSGSSIFGSGSSGDGPTTTINETNCKSDEPPTTRDSNKQRSGGLGEEQRAKGTSPKGASMEAPKGASIECSKGVGLESSKGAGLESQKGASMESSKGAGLVRSKGAVFEHTKGASMESSKRVGMESSKGVSMESSKGATMESSKRVNMESSKGASIESSKRVGMESSIGAALESSKSASTASSSVSKPSSTGGIYARLPLASGTASDPDDIEMHIKSSIVVKGAAARSPISTKSLNGSHGQRTAADHNQNVREKEPLEEVAEELHEFGQPHRVVVVEGPVLERDMFPLVAAKSANGELSAEEPGGDSAFVKLNGGGNELETEVNLDASLNSKDPLAIEEGEFDPNVSVSAVHFLDDEVVIEMANEPATVDEDVISLGSPSALWLSETGGGEAFAEASTSAGKTRSSLTATTAAASSCLTSNTTTTSKLAASTKGRLEASAKVCDEDHPSDGSDSGLGSETSTLQNSTLADSSSVDGCLNTSLDGKKGEGAARPVAKPLRSNLKRRLAEGTGEAAAVAKKPKRSINFEGVQVYYFQRQQGFGCVPSAGGCTLGMSATHSSMRSMTLTEHAAELRRAHRLQLQQQQEASRQRHSVASGAAASVATASGSSQAGGSSSDDSEESEEDYLSEGSGSDLDGETNGFLQPVTPKQRRIILKAAGVRKIDASEKIECRNIRDSRDVCGCTCRDFCDPDTCACSQAGIKCQVDRASFPCGCSRDSCGNVVGRVEFNPDRVRTHFIHTLLRLNMENGVPPPPVGGVDINTSAVTGSSSLSSPGSGIGGGSGGGYYGMQSQSAYSSGYASPAYSGELQSYYQPQLMADTHHQTQQHAYSATASGSNVTGPASVYQMDSLDSGLFGASSTNATPSYGELMPSYAATPTYAHAMGYDYGGGGSGQTSSYGSYHHLHPHHLSHSHNHATHHHQHHQSSAATPYQTASDLAGNTDGGVVTVAAYQSCAVPSMPPYGSATTTTASSTPYPSVAAVTRGNGLNIADPAAASTGGSNFINLSPPIASSSRLTQINDLLQHNRNTTAALVAVVSSGMSATSGLDKERGQPALQHMLSSINTPPIEDAQRSCLNFETLPSPLHPTPIVAVLADEQQPRRIDESPPKPPSEPPPPPPLSTQTPQQPPTAATAIPRQPNEALAEAEGATKAKDTTMPGSATGSQQVSAIPRL